MFLPYAIYWFVAGVFLCCCVLGIAAWLRQRARVRAEHAKAHDLARLTESVDEQVGLESVVLQKAGP